LIHFGSVLLLSILAFPSGDKRNLPHTWRQYVWRRLLSCVLGNGKPMLVRAAAQHGYSVQLVSSRFSIEKISPALNSRLRNAA
jgi:hypothetical protein